jgi:hypothetical protein
MKPKKQAKPDIGPLDLLDAVPQRNAVVTSELADDGSVVLSVPLRQRWFMKPPFSLIFPFSSRRRVSLDKLGSEVWKQCDGSRSTEKIIEEFAARHAMTFHETRLSVMLFFRSLAERGLIAMVGVKRQNQES